MWELFWVTLRCHWGDKALKLLKVRRHLHLQYMDPCIPVNLYTRIPEESLNSSTVASQRIRPWMGGTFPPPPPLVKQLSGNQVLRFKDLFFGCIPRFESFDFEDKVLPGKGMISIKRNHFTVDLQNFISSNFTRFANN